MNRRRTAPAAVRRPVAIRQRLLGSGVAEVGGVGGPVKSISPEVAPTLTLARSTSAKPTFRFTDAAKGTITLAIGRVTSVKENANA